jgi:hypothetical protein
MDDPDWRLYLPFKAAKTRQVSFEIFPNLIGGSRYLFTMPDFRFELAAIILTGAQEFLSCACSNASFKLS